MIGRRPYRASGRRILLWSLVLSALAPAAGAQLISPGKLSSAHEALEGISSCTSCHALGERGISAAKCLGCHEPRAVRIAAGKGLHGRMEQANCGDCHAEHYGREFRIVRFDTAGFDHADTGYSLVSAHAAAACRSCHRPSFVADPVVLRFKAPAGATGRTYLGLDPRCEGCHEADDPHGGQFADPDCSTCHDEARWARAARFDHAKTDFPLTGLHRGVACVSCHPSRTAIPGPGTLRYSGIAFAGCASCHRDPHAGRMGTACAGCHGTDGWSKLTGGTFATAVEHSRTGFDLEGAHAAAPCSSCHERGATASRTVRLRFASGSAGRRFPVPAHDSCADCHLDAHAGGLPMRGGASPCTDCHTSAAWAPSTFAPGRHAPETRFALTGAHVAVACSGCHVTDPVGLRLDFRHERTDCAGCHAKDDPHRGQFEAGPDSVACASCHVTDDWRMVSFDHARTRFPLSGRHAAAACVACHRAGEGEPVPYRDLDTSCNSCHREDDPHAEQFADRPCSECHDAESFRLSGFDHTRTRFPLDRAHERVPCGRCHLPESGPDGRRFVRFRPIDTRCTACHAS
jgi:hypothetical protein